MFGAIERLYFKGHDPFLHFPWSHNIQGLLQNNGTMDISNGYGDMRENPKS